MLAALPGCYMGRVGDKAVFQPAIAAEVSGFKTLLESNSMGFAFNGLNTVVPDNKRSITRKG